MDAMPIGAFFLVVVAVIFVAIEAGYRFGSAAHRRSDDEKESPVSAMAGAVLGLTAFILAFTFGMVANRFDTRKQLVLDDANALRTAWHQSDFLPEPERTEARSLLKHYLDDRLSLSQGEFDAEEVKTVLADAERIQAQLWEIALANARKDLNSDIGALYIEAIDELFGIHAMRVAIGVQMRVPMGIWLILVAMTALGMVSVGYQTGIAGSRRSKVQRIIAVSFAIVIATIAALDRPMNTFLKVSQQPLIDVRSWMESQSEAPAAN